MFLKLQILLVLANIVFGVHYEWPKSDKTTDKWVDNARLNIHKLLNRRPNGNIAKNLILFLGDGMGITTITAGRILKGQKKHQSGEEEITYMESLDHVALSKTYNINAQVPDSAGTATAYLCGVKTGVSIIGLDGNAILKNCTSSLNSHVDSIIKWAHKAGKRTGIVTTTRITHATPAAAYAHSASRNWESYNGVEFTATEKLEGCSDIASQLIDDNSFINVIFGGGRRHFLPKSVLDYDNNTAHRGERIDGRHLINEWRAKMHKTDKKHKYLWNGSDLKDLDPNEHDHVLGLFAYDHLHYEVDRKPNSTEPSLMEMTEAAIKILENGENGYVLLVEGGRIDHGHHESKAKKALEEFVMFDDTIGRVLNTTSQDETLIVVTADHSHTLSVGGFAARGVDIFGITMSPDKYMTDLTANLTFTTLLYANGPGALRKIRKRNLTYEETSKPDYVQESTVYLKMETHGAEDVAIFASGPMSHLFEGTLEQSYIPHAMAYAACIGPMYYSDECRNERGVLFQQSSAFKLQLGFNFFIILILSLFLSNYQFLCAL